MARQLMSDNIILLTDSYKIAHYRQYPPKTTTVYSYFESRGGDFPETVFFGLQYILERYLAGPVVTQAKIDEAKEVFALHFGDDKLFNAEGWEYILKEHNGHLPIRIKAVPEGTVVPVKNVLITIENTDPQTYWLTNYLETILVEVWYPLTVATYSRELKKIIAGYLSETADDLSGLPFKLHDFGYRGVSSVETAGIGGASHLVNFMGTDTIAGFMLARQYYGSTMAGYSIPATEHSTMTSWGRAGESAAYKNLLEQFPSGVVACVSDSYDIFNACENIWGKELKDLIVERGKDGKSILVIRPDSGDPATVVVRILEIFGERFGTTTNSKGFKVLPPYIRIIQGDGISYASLKQILQHMKDHKWSADNVAYGSGGALLQRHHRDTQKCALKCSFAVVNGENVNVFKDPITDPGKKSKTGRLTLERTEDGKFVTQVESKGDPAKDLLVTVFENGVMVKRWTLDEIRERAAV
ncbi:pre-B-cell colony-enhancing factor [Capsaspora owczarzaki ATCC 30864]|uniref:Nicotinamide phosphoribosyltransferase n=1 Tax=Capsaspora owczarzaki (strain ATCC 30864) TaxID=595528 RepID=A0A0D2VNZ3_CAPO3|nr:pre-B-cell colony-enhancing factor [Capsaspora owczarzaki ATCC 30864]KJE92087.1 pre-B-cell colony-enhancing factor [Capsaspora owczarzaki ATCC 30864]|eukprot:XP_004363953.2 pre-B-cell colony-enhancing factor [Capsaspora owczarzaki ATCC 30864]